MNQKKRTFTVLLLCICSFSFFSQQNTKTPEERRRDIIQFGLENEVIDLVDILRKEQVNDFNEELVVLFNRTRSPGVRESILGLFTELAVSGLSDWALRVLEEPFEYRLSTVSAVLSYAGAIRLTEAAPHVRALIDRDQSEYRSAAIAALGKIGNVDDGRFLLDYFTSEIPGDEKTRLVTRQAVMAALAELHLVELWDEISTIVSDTDENLMIRASAAESISKMGKEEAIPVLVALYEDRDPHLRTAAVKGLGNFEGAEVDSVLIEGLRDSYFRVRLEAIGSAEKRRLSQASALILYRARNDPVEQVRLRSFDALAVMQDPEGCRWLKETLSDAKRTDRLRFQAASALIRLYPDFAVAEIRGLAEEALADDRKTWLRYELGKVLHRQGGQHYSAVAASYLAHKDVLTRSIGLDLFAKYRFPSLSAAVEAIAADEKQGALQRRAKQMLDNPAKDE